MLALLPRFLCRGFAAVRRDTSVPYMQAGPTSHRGLREHARKRLADMYLLRKNSKALGNRNSARGRLLNYERTFECHAKAQFSLGVLLARGHGVHRSLPEAVNWHQKAAAQGYPESQYEIGLAYDGGHGVSQSHVEAARWYRMAADQGLAMAQVNLGNFYGKGLGVKQSEVEAVEYLRRAAAQGNLGVRYSEGQGVEQNYSMAAKYYRKAADMGYASACLNLGVM